MFCSIGLSYLIWHRDTSVNQTVHYHFKLRERYTINLSELQSDLTGRAQILNQSFNHPPGVIWMKSIKGSFISRKSCTQLVEETYARSPLWRCLSNKTLWVFLSSLIHLVGSKVDEKGKMSVGWLYKVSKLYKHTYVFGINFLILQKCCKYSRKCQTIKK